MSIKSDQIAWRRSKVVEYRARGMTHEEIAHELQVSRQSITSDIGYLREQAKESIKEYATEHLPAQYQICLTALDSIIKHAYQILQDSYDNREKVQALQLFKDTHLEKLEILSNATTIDHALNIIRSKQSQHKKDYVDYCSRYYNRKAISVLISMRDPIMTYIRIIEDLQRLAATSTESQPFDPDMVYEIVELKRELERKHGIVYFDVDDDHDYYHYMHERPFSLEPAIKKCSKCGATKGCKHDS